MLSNCKRDRGFFFNFFSRKITLTALFDDNTLDISFQSVRKYIQINQTKGTNMNPTFSDLIPKLLVFGELGCLFFEVWFMKWSFFFLFFLLFFF